MKKYLPTIFIIIGLTILLGVILFLIIESYVSYKKRLENYKVSVLFEEKKKVDEKGKRHKALRIVSFVIDGLLLVLLAGVVTLTITTKLSHNTFTPFNGLDDVYVLCETGSMSKVHKDNTYIKDNNLTNQIKTHSLIKLKKIKNESEINVYDVCAYRDKNKDLIIHRIISTLEYEGETYYVFRGDANNVSDQYVLKANEIEYKYTGEHNDGLGYFISYLKSPIGIVAITYTLIILVMFDIYDEKRRKFLIEYVPDMKWYESDILYKEEMKEQEKLEKKEEEL